MHAAAILSAVRQQQQAQQQEAELPPELLRQGDEDEEDEEEDASEEGEGEAGQEAIDGTDDDDDEDEDEDEDEEELDSEAEVVPRAGPFPNLHRSGGDIRAGPSFHPSSFATGSKRGVGHQPMPPKSTVRKLAAALGAQVAKHEEQTDKGSGGNGGNSGGGLGMMKHFIIGGLALIVALVQISKITDGWSGVPGGNSGSNNNGAGFGGTAGLAAGSIGGSLYFSKSVISVRTAMERGLKEHLVPFPEAVEDPVGSSSSFLLSLLEASAPAPVETAVNGIRRPPSYSEWKAHKQMGGSRLLLLMSTAGGKTQEEDQREGYSSKDDLQRADSLLTQPALSLVALDVTDCDAASLPSSSTAAGAGAGAGAAHIDGHAPVPNGRPPQVDRRHHPMDRHGQGGHKKRRGGGLFGALLSLLTPGGVGGIEGRGGNSRGNSLNPLLEDEASPAVAQIRLFPSLLSHPWRLSPSGDGNSSSNSDEPVAAATKTAATGWYAFCKAQSQIKPLPSPAGGVGDGGEAGGAGGGARARHTVLPRSYRPPGSNDPNPFAGAAERRRAFDAEEFRLQQQRNLLLNRFPVCKRPLSLQAEAEAWLFPALHPSLTTVLRVLMQQKMAVLTLGCSGLTPPPPPPAQLATAAVAPEGAVEASAAASPPTEPPAQENAPERENIELEVASLRADGEADVGTSSSGTETGMDETEAESSEASAAEKDEI